MVEGAAIVGVDVCDEKVLVERCRLGRKLAPRGKDEAPTNAHLLTVGSKRSHANDPSARCLGIVYKAALGDCHAHARGGVVQDKSAAVKVQQHIKVKVIGVKVIQIVKGES